MSWTPDRVEKLKALHREGHSCSQIAKALGGCTRNAVIGKITRLGMNMTIEQVRATQALAAASRNVARVPKAPAVKRNLTRDTNRGKGFIVAKRGPAPRLVPAGGNTVIVCPPSHPPLAVTKAAAFEALPGSEPRPYLTRKFGECAWPVGPDGDGQLSCCLPVDRRGWCAAHFRLGTQPASVKAKVDQRLDIPKAKRWAA